MPRTPPLSFQPSLRRALMAAHRHAMKHRQASRPTRGELYQALVDQAVLTEDVEAKVWIESVRPVTEGQGEPMVLRPMLTRLRRRGPGAPIRLVELLRLVTGPHSRAARNLPTTRGPTLPAPIERGESRVATRPPKGELVVRPPPSPPAAPEPAKSMPPSEAPPEPRPTSKHPPGFHCPECCPKAERRRAKKKKQKRTATEEAEAFLESIGGELTAARRMKSLNPAQGRGRELDQIFEAMLMMHRPNPILVGRSGVGKSAILEGVARRLMQNDCPTRLRGTRVFRLDASLFRAQAGIIGRIEDFLERLVQALETVGPATLAIDEFHLITGTGAHKDDPKGAEQYIREHMSRGRLRILGTTTPGEYERFIAEDRSLESRLVKIPIEEPSLAVARRMVRVAARRMEDHYGRRVPPILADYATRLCFEHPTGVSLPLAAVDLLDWSMARAEARGREPVAEDVEESLARQLGCEATHIRQEGSAKIRQLGDALAAEIKGQKLACADAVAALKPYSAGLKDPNRPAATLMFAGPTGVGKTETAKQIARCLFGSERSLVRVAMADFTDAWAATRLIGSGPGYVGHEKGGWLVRRLRETPSCVLLLDEFDRAHQAVRDIFLEAFDNARLRDSRGLEASLTHTIVILTSNLGADGVRTPGFTRDASKSSRDRLIRVLKENLSPALVGRLNAVIPYDSLDEAALEEILDLKRAKLEKRLGLNAGEVILEPDLRAAIIRRGFAPATGARGLDEALEKLVVRPLAAKILDEGRPKAGRAMHLGMGDVAGG